jgi:hypothetical protein
MSQTITPTHFSTKDLLIAAQRPKKTKSYSPVPHKDVISTVLESLDRANLKVSSECYSSARDGKQAMGFYNLLGAGDDEMQIRLIWHNSYDKSMPLRCALGGNVIVCTNGVVRGDMGAFKRKHTGTVLTEFKEDISRYIDTAGDLFTKMIREKQRMKEIECTKKTCAELLGRMYVTDNILTATQIGIVKKELEAPTYDYKADGTLWQFYNHNTVALKDQHPMYHLDSHQKLHKFVVNEFAKEFA